MEWPGYRQKIRGRRFHIGKKKEVFDGEPLD